MAIGLAEGRSEGLAKGMAKGIIQMGLRVRCTRPQIMEQLVSAFNGDQQEAEQALNSYIQKHPEEAACLED